MKTLAPLLAIVAALSLSATARAQDAATGAALYIDHGCYGCHGYAGAGRTPLDARTSGILADVDIFITFLRLRAEQNPILPSASMPNYPEESLPDADARDLHAYIATFAHDDPAAEDVPILKDLLDAAQADAP